VPAIPHRDSEDRDSERISSLGLTLIRWFLSPKRPSGGDSVASSKARIRNDPRAFLEALQPPVVREGSPTGRRLSRFGDHPSPRQRNIVGVERTCFAACNTRHGTDGRTADRQDTRPVILDEIQRAPQILLAVKRAVDELRRPGDFILTSSANLLLMKHVADTLAGRAIYLDLQPMN